MATTYDKASLVMIPSGYKDDKLYSVKPTDGSGDFTFSRDGAGASPATRVNASGLIEKGRENVLTYSNDFSNAAWSKVSATITGGQADKDGGSNAWLLAATANGGNIINYNSLTGVKSFSCYMKAGTASWGRLRFDNSPSADVNVWFNLSTGAVGTNNNGIHAYTEDVGSGWYRVVIVGNSSDLSNVRIYVADSDGTDVTNGLNIYIQDAQLEQGLVATDYIETTTAPVSAGLLGDMPRLDYSGGATCPSLLLEPSRVNLVDHSEYIGSLTPEKGTITSNADTSPEGVVNATSFVEDNTTGRHRTSFFESVTSGQTYTFSMFAKIKSGTRLLCINNAATIGARAYFDLVNGEVEGIDAGTASIEDYGNGWYRCSVTATSSVTGNATTYFGLEDGVVDNGYAGDGTSGHYWYGLQLEAGSYPTSYIPTYGSASTRGVDDCEKLSATDIIGQTEGTLFLDFVPQSKDFQIIYQVRTTGSSNVGQIDFRYQSGNLRALGSDGGVTQFAILGGDIVVGQRYKCAVRYAENDVAFYVNGSLAGTDTSASFSSSSLQQISFSENAATFYPQADVKQALLFKTGLTNAELAALTTI